MAFSCIVGTTKTEDAVDYCRQQTGDTDATTQVIPDDFYLDAVNDVTSDLGRFVDLTDIVGDIYHLTSPWLTVMGQQRYQLTAANGFNHTVDLGAPIQVLYQAGSGYSAAAELGYFALMPFTPDNLWLFAPNLLDSPSRRLIRDEYLNELEHYGMGSFEARLDPTGVPVIDLYPVPMVNGVPIYCRYSTPLATSPIAGDPDGSVKLTVADQYIRHFKRLLLAEAREYQAQLAAGNLDAKAGEIELRQDPQSFMRMARDLRQRVYDELGVNAGYAEASR